MCIDYMTLNLRTIPDPYTVPLIQEAIDCLNGNQWFAVIDLKSRFYQIPMREDDKARTVFICLLGWYMYVSKRALFSPTYSIWSCLQTSWEQSPLAAYMYMIGPQTVGIDLKGQFFRIRQC